MFFYFVLVFVIYFVLYIKLKKLKEKNKVMNKDKNSIFKVKDKNTNESFDVYDIQYDFHSPCKVLFLVFDKGLGLWDLVPSNRFIPSI